MLFKWTREIGVYASERVGTPFQGPLLRVPRREIGNEVERVGVKSVFWRRNSTEKSLTRLKEFIVSPFDEHL